MKSQVRTRTREKQVKRLFPFLRSAGCSSASRSCAKSTNRAITHEKCSVENGAGETAAVRGAVLDAAPSAARPPGAAAAGINACRASAVEIPPGASEEPEAALCEVATFVLLVDGFVSPIWAGVPLLLVGMIDT